MAYKPDTKTRNKILKMLREADDDGMKVVEVGAKFNRNGQWALYYLQSLREFELAGYAGHGSALAWIDAPRVDMLEERIQDKIVRRLAAERKCSYDAARKVILRRRARGKEEVDRKRMSRLFETNDEPVRRHVPAGEWKPHRAPVRWVFDLASIA
jgi:Asp-tRNA(Asn)/Glu-tRNA(Gln) amidotransferase A subunit family amidase